MKKLIYTLPLLLALGACSEEATDSPVIEGDGGYYLTMSLTVPTELMSTRSTTTNNGGSSDGLLGGTEAESTISTIDLYLLDADDTDVSSGHEKYKILWSKTGITNGSDHTISKNNSTANDRDATYDITVKLNANTDLGEPSTTNLNSIKNLAGHNISVLVVCNPDQYNNYSFATNNTPKKVDYTLVSPINSFGTVGKEMPMANAAESYVHENFKDLSTLTDVKGQFSPEDNKLIYNLTPTVSSVPQTIDVERAVARLDIAGPENWIYDLYDGSVDNGASDIQIKMYSIQPFNVNANAYVVRHTASGSSTEATGDIDIFGNEKGTDSDTYTWVADPNWGIKSTTGSPYYTESTPTKNVLSNTYPFSVTSESAVTDSEQKISDLQDTTSDTYLGTTYYPWCYVAENTIPSTADMTMEGPTATLPGHATGVLFKFQILTNEVNAEPITISTDTSKYPEGVTKDESDNLVITLAKSGKTQTIAPSGTDYYLIYRGFIPHNGTITSTNPMNYGVVRNNVYQMKVGTIVNLPDPTDAEYYLTLQVNVLKWNRRVIDFNF